MSFAGVHPLKPKSLILGLALGLAVAAGLFWGLINALADREPSYAGKSLDQWLAELDSGDAARSNHACVILNGTIIPELSDQILHDTNDSAVKLTLVHALNGLPGVRIVSVLAATRRSNAAQALGKFGPPANAAVPVLLQVVNGKDHAPRAAAVTALGQIHSSPDTVVPVLIASLSDNDLNDSAAEALGQFGSLAGAAVPKLMPLVHSREKELRRATILALPKIDPKAAASAGITEQLVKRLSMDESAWHSLGQRTASPKKEP